MLDKNEDLKINYHEFKVRPAKSGFCFFFFVVVQLCSTAWVQTRNAWNTGYKVLFYLYKYNKLKYNEAKTDKEVEDISMYIVIITN